MEKLQTRAVFSLNWLLYPKKLQSRGFSIAGISAANDGWNLKVTGSNEFIDHNGDVLHYDKWLDTVVDAEGNDKRDGVNFLDDPEPEA